MEKTTRNTGTSTNRRILLKGPKTHDISKYIMKKPQMIPIAQKNISFYSEEIKHEPEEGTS
jgi:hypothetical protein